MMIEFDRYVCQRHLTRVVAKTHMRIRRKRGYAFDVKPGDMFEIYKGDLVSCLKHPGGGDLEKQKRNLEWRKKRWAEHQRRSRALRKLMERTPTPKALPERIQ